MTTTELLRAKESRMMSQTNPLNPLSLSSLLPMVPYAYDRVELMLRREISEAASMGIGYEFVSFNDHSGGFDDYQGHGLRTTYTCKF